MLLDWGGSETLADFNFEIQYKPGKLNTDADSLLRQPADFKEYIDSCIETIPPESL